LCFACFGQLLLQSLKKRDALKIFLADGIEDAIQDPLPAEANAEL
jgi:hypothetical protein